MRLFVPFTSALIAFVVAPRVLDQVVDDPLLELGVRCADRVELGDAVALRLDDPLEQARSRGWSRSAASPSASSPRSSFVRGRLPSCLELDLRVGVPAPVARDLAGLVLVVAEARTRAPT